MFHKSVVPVRWLIVAVLAALAWFSPRLGDPLGAIERLAARLAVRKRAVVVSIALAAILTRLALLYIMPVPVPGVHDEFSYLLAADTFAHGRLANPPHPMWIFFDTFHVFQHPAYASMFPPAQGGALALGQLLGHPWIGVLLSMAAMCAVVAWALQGWLPPQWALLGAVLVLLKIHLFGYWLESYWGGAVAAIGGALVAGALPRIIHHQRVRDAILMGIGASLLANSRPFEGLIFCIPVAVSLLVWLLSERSPALSITGRRVLLPLLGILAFTLVFTGYYNWRVTGNALLVPHVLYVREYINYPVFVWQRVNPPLRYANPQFDRFFNIWVRNHYRPSLQLAWQACVAWWQFFLGGALRIPFVTLPWLVKDRRTRFLLVQQVVSAVGLLLVVYFHPHYAAPLTATLFVLVVQGMRHLRQWEVKGRPVGVFLTRLVVLLMLARGVAYIRRPPSLDEAWVSRARIVKQLEATPGNHLVMLRYAPEHNVLYEWVYNAADIDHAKIVWAREIPGRDLKPLLSYFRGRTVWVVEADTVPVQLQSYQPPGTSSGKLSLLAAPAAAQ